MIFGKTGDLSPLPTGNSLGLQGFALVSSVLDVESDNVFGAISTSVIFGNDRRPDEGVGPLSFSKIC